MDGGHERPFPVHLIQAPQPGAIQAQGLCENAVVPPDIAPSILKALAAAQDSAHGLQHQVSSRNRTPAASARVGLPEAADQIDIGCGNSSFRHKAGGKHAVHQPMPQP